MKSLRKLFTLALALLLILECFAGPALATTPDAEAEILTVTEEAVADVESSEAEPSEPESSIPESSVPENTVPESSEEPSVPESSEEESSIPEGSEPEPSVPESSVPDVTVPESSEPEPSVPESSEPEPSVPESSEPEPSVPESSEPEPSVPESSEPEPSEPEPSEPTIVDSGKCGDNLTWTLDSDGLLVISGKGAMKNYTASSPAPWSGKQINTVVIKSGVTTIGNYAFNKCGVDIFSIPKTVTTLGNYALADNDMTELIFPAGATKFGDYALADCGDLKDLYLPTTLKTIGKHAFARCRIEYIDVPDSVTSLGEGAFFSCPRLESVYISRNLKTIKDWTFQYCASLKLVILPGSLTSIDFCAFSDCNSLQMVLYLGTQKQYDNLSIGSGNQDLISSKCKWYWYTIPTKDPKDVKTIAGKTVTFSTAASRSGCKFQWESLAPGSEEWKPCSSKSAKTATFSFTAKAKHDGYQYRCVITDKYDNQVATYSATLTVVPAPKITKQPENAEAKSGKSVSVSVEATGEGLTYQWYIAKKGSSKFSKSSITTNTYKTTMKSSVDGRKVYCVVTDKYGQTVKTNTVTLSLETTPLVITKQPESVTVKYGEKAKVTVAAEGDGLTYQWYFAKKGSSKFSKASTTKATYSVDMDTSRNGRQLYCVIKDKYGKSVKTDVVTINLEKTPLAIVTQPVGTNVGYGKTATVSVKAQGDGLTYQWYFAKKGSSKFSKASITKATYSVDMTASRDGRQLYCVITDAYGNSVKTDVVSITIARKELAIVTQPVSVKVKNGATAKVTVKATGDGLTYQWYYAAKGSKTFKKASITKATYSAVMNSSRNGRQLYCVITDAYGNTVKTNTVTIKKK